MNAFRKIIKGTAAGFVATGPMTIAMLLMYRLLPWWERTPLPPSPLTTQALKAVG